MGGGWVVATDDCCSKSVESAISRVGISTWFQNEVSICPLLCGYMHGPSLACVYPCMYT